MLHSFQTLFESAGSAGFYALVEPKPQVGPVLIARPVRERDLGDRHRLPSVKGELASLCETISEEQTLCDCPRSTLTVDGAGLAGLSCSLGRNCVVAVVALEPVLAVARGDRCL